MRCTQEKNSAYQQLAESIMKPLYGVIKYGQEDGQMYLDLQGARTAFVFPRLDQRYGKDRIGIRSEAHLGPRDSGHDLPRRHPGTFLAMQTYRKMSREMVRWG